MTKSSLAALALLLASGCSKVEPARAAEHERERGPEKVTSMRELPHLDSAPPSSGPYKPTASEVPLTEDFALAAEKRVTPDNYRAELVTIEKELAQLKASTEAAEAPGRSRGPYAPHAAPRH